MGRGYCRTSTVTVSRDACCTNHQLGHMICTDKGNNVVLSFVKVGYSCHQQTAKCCSQGLASPAVVHMHHIWQQV